MEQNQSVDQRVTGYVTARTYPPGYAYSRDSYKAGTVVDEGFNNITAAGRQYLATLARQNFSHIGVVNNAQTEVWKALATDRFSDSTSASIILYLSSVQPEVQPVTLVETNLYGQNGNLLIGRRAFAAPRIKTNELAMTIEWVVRFQ